MFLKILLPAFILLCIGMLGMALSILLKKNGRFPVYQVGHNKHMKKAGIHCVKHEELRCHKKNPEKQGCAGCV
ncbi:MAG: hypothetical protein CSA96_07315 [Bacteroidetes bacterium]|nr:MAG: hypothetical protein CSA96_07315 [Bacteroidota bacterium]